MHKGVQMIKLGVLASTRATDMQAVIDAINAKKLNAVISVVVSNKPDAYALERAKNHHIKTGFIDPKGKTREEYDKEVSKVLDGHKADLILLDDKTVKGLRSFQEGFRNSDGSPRNAKVLLDLENITAAKTIKFRK